MTSEIGNSLNEIRLATIEKRHNGAIVESNTVEVEVRVYHRILDGGEREIRVEVSRPADCDFIYAGGVTRSSFPRIKSLYNLRMEFETFGAKLIAQLSSMSNNEPVHLYCVITDNKCTLERERESDMLRTPLPIELAALEGDELLTYLRAELRKSRNLNKKLSEGKRQMSETVSGLRERIEEHEREEERLREEIRQKEDQLEDARCEVMDKKQDTDEFRSMYESMEEAYHEAKAELDEKILELTDLQALYKELLEKNEICEEWCNDLQAQLDEANRKLDSDSDGRARLRSELSKIREQRDAAEKANSRLEQDMEKMKKIVADTQLAIKQRLKRDIRGEEATEQTPSCDMKKLEELANDIREKNELIDQLMTREKALQMALDEAILAKKEMERKNKDLAELLDKAQRLNEMYRASSLRASRSSMGGDSQTALDKTVYYTPPTSNTRVCPPVVSPMVALPPRQPLPPLTNSLSQRILASRENNPRVPESPGSVKLSYNALRGTHK